MKIVCLISEDGTKTFYDTNDRIEKLFNEIRRSNAELLVFGEIDQLLNQDGTYNNDLI